MMNKADSTSSVESLDRVDKDQEALELKEGGSSDDEWEKQ
jgi:hypothetical protein